MRRIEIDQTKCQKDGICVAVCPVGVLRLQDGDGYPEVTPGGEMLCIACGHCVAACPTEAVEHTEVRPEKCPPIRKELKINFDQALQFLRTRRSIRIYQDKPVEKETMVRLIEIARYAPTGSNAQLVEWIAYNDRNQIRELAGTTVDCIRRLLQEESKPATLPAYYPLVVAAWDMGIDAVLRNAPALIIAMAPEEAANGMVDLSLALCYLELIAPTLGLGTCWAGILRRGLTQSPALRKAIGIPEGYPHYYPMMLGVPKFTYHRLPERRQPKITWRQLVFHQTTGE
jgi:nitroreductase/NAD-dependent dihydropyrimidine dehydrogenase PreA subunit